MAILIRAALLLVGTTAYLGLAVLGWGGFTAFFSHPALVALAIVLFVMAVVSAFAGGNLSPGCARIVAIAGSWRRSACWDCSTSVLPAWTDRIGFWTLDGDAVRWVGVAVFAVGGALRLWPVFVLGDRFSGLVAIQPGHTLVTGGIFGVIRNPSYLGMLVNALGWGLAFRSGVGVVLAVLSSRRWSRASARRRRLLRSQFGAEYEAYCARTSRLIPGVY